MLETDEIDQIISELRSKQFIEFKDREKFDITNIADEIYKKDLGERARKEYLMELWEKEQNQWKAFFGFDQKYFINEVYLALQKQSFPEPFEKYKDNNGFYTCAISGEKSKSKITFQIDHIKPISKGGLTILKNLQILTRKENAKKGDLYVRKYRPNFKRQKNSGFIH